MPGALNFGNTSFGFGLLFLKQSHLSFSLKWEVLLGKKKKSQKKKSSIYKNNTTKKKKIILIQHRQCFTVRYTSE